MVGKGNSNTHSNSFFVYIYDSAKQRYYEAKGKIKHAIEMLDLLYKSFENNKVNREEGMEIIKRAKKILEDP